MSARDQMETVLRVACLTEDRSGDEQRAMLDTAHRLDSERSEFTITNRHPKPPALLDLVVATYDPSEGRRVEPSNAQREKQKRMKAKWVRCGECGWPVGAHYADNVCPHTPADLEILATIGTAP